VIRPATVDDVPVVLTLVHELARYEREPDAVLATEETLAAALFGDNPRVFCHVAEDSAGAVVGFAVWFFNFSTWLGRHGVYLEDLFVRPESRGAGHGRALLTELARIAVANDCGRVEWAVLDWNVDAQAFYSSLGAQPMDEWTTWRLTGHALGALGSDRAG
jgi:GNAT superfamily N-acetyltransferase